MATHSGCMWDFPDEATPFAAARAARLMVASLKDDDSIDDGVLDEIGDCPQCLRFLINFFVGMTGEISISLAEALGADRELAHDLALGQFEKQLAQAIRDLPR